MAKIQKSSIKDQVYELVKERIFSQYYPSGEEIKILTLSKELGVSNTPIREALTMLVAEGLLTTSVNNKFKVIELNEKEMSELNEVISIILVGGYRAAHRDGRDKDMYKLLEKRYEAQVKAREKNNLELYIQKTLEFDRSFVEVTGNEKLLNIFDMNNYLLYLYVRHTHWKDEENTDRKLQEHVEIMDAVKKGDWVLVEKLLTEHYDEHYGK